MFKEVSELCLAQADDGLPTAVASGSAPGESGLLVGGRKLSQPTAPPNDHGTARDRSALCEVVSRTA
jgi:hypothetical protein